LVLDWVDLSLVVPVDLGWEVDLGEDLDVLLEVVGVLSSESEKLSVLFLGPGGELVVSDGEGVVLVGVDLLVLGVLLGEDAESEVELFLSSVGESHLVDVVHEGTLDLWGGEVCFLLAHVGLESEVGGGFAEVLHLCF